MPETLSGYLTTTQTLGAGGTVVSVAGTINAYGAAGTYTVNAGQGPVAYGFDAAVFGPAPGDFTIINSGVIETQGTNSGNLFDAGIVLGAAGTIASSGTILGASGVALLGAAGGNYVDNSGVIFGSIGGGIVGFASLAVTNAGTVGGEKAGLFLAAGGALDNRAGGMIESAGGYAVQSDVAASLSNAGTLVGFYGGFNVRESSTLSARNDGLIVATGTGVAQFYGGIKGGAGSSIVNAGTILGENGIAVQPDHYGLTPGLVTAASYILNSGTIQAVSQYNNQFRQSGSFTNIGGTGNFGVGIELGATGTVLNTGTIAASADGVWLQTNYDITEYDQTPLVSNASGGQISSGEYGAYLTGAGRLNNAGRIFANDFGVKTGPESPAWVTNSGTIRVTGSIFSNGGGLFGQTMAAAGIDLTSGGTVNNSGLVSGAIGVEFAAGVAPLGQQGVVTGPAPAALGGTIDNQGTILAAAAADPLGFLGNGFLTLGVGILATAGAAVENSGLISASRAGLVEAGLAASVENDAGGTIAGAAGYGVVLEDGGALSNAGTIIGYRDGVHGAYVAASVGNAGLIEATGHTFVTDGPGHGNSLGAGTYVSTGVRLRDGGTVLNSLAGTIIAAVGVVIDGVAQAYVTNDGLIEATDRSGVYLQVGGTVSNFGTVEGTKSAVDLNAGGALANYGLLVSSLTQGVYAGGAASLFNTGTIAGAQYGVLFARKGSVTNAAGGTISGGAGGVQINGFDSFVDNEGLVRSATAKSAIELGNFGTIDNAGTAAGGLVGADLAAGGLIENTGLLSGKIGVEMSTGGTVVNAGTIVGTDGAAVFFNVGPANTLVVDPGAVFIGSVDGGDGLGIPGVSVLELAGTGGRLNGFGVQFFDFQTVSFGENPGWTLDGGNAALTTDGANDPMTNGVSITGFGAGDVIVLDGFVATGLNVGPGGLTLAGPVPGGFETLDLAGNFSASDFALSNDGVNSTITALGYAADLAIGAGESVVVAAGQTLASPTIAGGALALGSGAGVTGDIAFSGSGGTLVLEPDAEGGTSVPDNTITGFGVGDTIKLAGVPFSAADDSYTVANAGTLTIDAAGTLYSLLIAGAYVGESDFSIAGDLSVTENVMCFCPGTRILTPAGEVPVEELAIGDAVSVLAGGARRIKWIGRRGYEGRAIAGAHLKLPVCVRAGAVAAGVPARDLWVSPGHGLWVDGALAPAWRLVNGVSIVQAKAVERVSYLHVELDEHEILIAEGLGAESFYDDGSRGEFANAADFWARYPLDRPGVALARTEDGFALEAIRQRLAARAGILPPSGMPGALRGFVDGVSAGVIAGWAQDEAAPETPVCLDVFADGRRVGRVLANVYRADLRAAGLGSGCHGFAMALPAWIGPVEVRRSADGAMLEWAAAALAA